MRRFASIGLDEDTLRVVEPLFVALFVPRVIQLFVDPLSFGRLYVIVAAIMLAIVISTALRPFATRDASFSGSADKGAAVVQIASLFVFGASVHPALLTLASLCGFGLLSDSLLTGVYLAASLPLACGGGITLFPRVETLRSMHWALCFGTFLLDCLCSKCILGGFSSHYFSPYCCACYSSLGFEALAPKGPLVPMTLLCPSFCPCPRMLLTC